MAVEDKIFTIRINTKRGGKNLFTFLTSDLWFVTSINFDTVKFVRNKITHTKLRNSFQFEANRSSSSTET